MQGMTTWTPTPKDGEESQHKPTQEGPVRPIIHGGGPLATVPPTRYGDKQCCPHWSSPYHCSDGANGNTAGPILGHQAIDRWFFLVMDK